MTQVDRVFYFFLRGCKPTAILRCKQQTTQTKMATLNVTFTSTDTAATVRNMRRSGYCDVTPNCSKVSATLELNNSKLVKALPFYLDLASLEALCVNSLTLTDLPADMVVELCFEVLSEVGNIGTIHEEFTSTQYALDLRDLYVTFE